MLDFISNCKQTIIKYKKQLFSFSLISLFIFNFSLSPSAATVILGDGANGLVKFDKPLNSNGYLNNRSVITKEGYLSVTGDTSVLYGHSSGSCNVVSNVPIDFTDVNSISISYDIITTPFDSSNIWFGFGLLNQNNNISSVDYREGNACCPKYIYGDSSKGLSSPIVLDTTDVIGNYYISFGYVTPYHNDSDTTSIKFYDLILYDSNGDIVGVIDVIEAIQKQTDSIMNAGSDFSGTSSGILSGNDELSGFIDDYTEIEQSMYDKFTENQSAVIGNFSGFSWGSLSTAVDWTSDYLNRIYDNSGDFRTMFMYPILSGIALIFIGRQGLTAYVRSRREK